MRKSGVLFRAMFEATVDAILIVDEQGRIVLANQACELLFGYPQRRLSGWPIERLIPERFDNHRELRERYFRDPQPRPMGHGLELFVLHADGGEIPVDISLTPVVLDGHNWSACAIRDMRGKVRQDHDLRVRATALESAANGVVITDRDGIITWVNPVLCKITGYRASELIGQHTRILKSGQHDPSFYRELWETVSSGHTWVGAIINRRRDGSLYHEEQTIAPVLDETGEITHYIAIKHDATERLRAEESLAAANVQLGNQLQEIETLNRRLREESIRDPLTGLYNRRYFEETIVREVSRTRRMNQAMAIAMLDLDHFKDINDTHGHATGDRVLQALARALMESLRGSDLICRWGGEEFVAVLVDTEPEDALAKAEGLRRQLAEQVVSTTDGEEVRCSVSIGLAFLTGLDTDFLQALERADAALYLAKDRGRNRVACSSDSVARARGKSMRAST